MRKLISVTALQLSVIVSFGQLKQDIIGYVEKYKNVAIEEMVRTNIPASITLAQGILESGCGKSDLSVKANNHFGIKCKDEWSGKRFYQDDDAPNECFRVYENARESYADHSDFLLTRARYAELFKLPAGDYKSWANGLKEAGYATNPKYAPILIKYIEDYQLHEYDKVGYALIENRNFVFGADSAKSKYEVAEVKKEVDVFEKGKNEQSKSDLREEFVVNGVRALKAKANEDPFALAFEYNIDYEHMLSFNDMSTGDKFKAGEYVFLQPKRNKAEVSTYKIKGGESMRDVAQMFGVKLKELYTKNLMTANDQAKGGEIIYLQEKRTNAPATISYSQFLKTLNVFNATGSNSDSFINRPSYSVQQKDTLYSIAKRFNTTVEKIQELNNIEGTSLKPGQTLVVSE